jgi:hypothetical protein
MLASAGNKVIGLHHFCRWRSARATNSRETVDEKIARPAFAQGYGERKTEPGRARFKSDRSPPENRPDG